MSKRIMIGAAVALMVVMLAGVAAAAGGNGVGKMLGGFRGVFGEKLGITCEEMQQARTAGQTLRQLLESKGIDVEALVRAEVQTRTEMINKLVTEGKLTREQADLCLANLEEKLNARLDSSGGCQQQAEGKGYGKGIGGKMGIGKMKMQMKGSQCPRGK